MSITSSPFFSILISGAGGDTIGFKFLDFEIGLDLNVIETTGSYSHIGERACLILLVLLLVTTLPGETYCLSSFSDGTKSWESPKKSLSRGDSYGERYYF